MSGFARFVLRLYDARDWRQALNGPEQIFIPT